jgi:hypothetical protein
VDLVDGMSISFRSLGYNLIGAGTATWVFLEGEPTYDKVIFSADPLLGQLQDNGGPTWTHALRSGSPAIDGGDPDLEPNAPVPPNFDQRGLPRVCDGDGIGEPCMDIGAYESQTVLVPLVGDYDHDGVVDELDLVVWRGQFGLTSPGAAADGDADGDVDGADFLIWQRGLGVAAGAIRAHGNADGDEDVDGADLGVGTGQFAATAAPHSAAAMTAASDAPAAAIADEALAQLARSPGVAYVAESLRSEISRGEDANFTPRVSERRDHVDESLRDSHRASRRDETPETVRHDTPDLQPAARRRGLGEDGSAAALFATIRDRALELIGGEEIVGTSIWR